MSLNTSEFHVKDEPPWDPELTIKTEPEIVQIVQIVQEVKVEWDSYEQNLDTSCASLYPEVKSSDTDFIDHVKVENENDNGVSIGLSIKQEVKEENEYSAQEFQQKIVSLSIKQEVKEENEHSAEEFQQKIVVPSKGINRRYVRQPPALSLRQLLDQKLLLTSRVYKCGFCNLSSRYKSSIVRHQKKHIEDSDEDDIFEPPSYSLRDGTLLDQKSEDIEGYCDLPSEYKSSVERHQNTHIRASSQPKKKEEQSIQNTPVEENRYKCSYCPYTTRYQINYTRHETEHILENHLRNLENQRNLAMLAEKVIKENLIENEKNKSIDSKFMERLYQVNDLENKRESEKVTEIKPLGNQKNKGCESQPISQDYLKNLENKGKRRTMVTEMKPEDQDSKICESIKLVDEKHLKHAIPLDTDTPKYVYNDIKPFHCIYCKFSSFYRSNLKRHEKTYHSCERPYKCQHCDNNFALKSTLKQHLKVHGPKPFKCTYCSHSSNHKQHVKIHESSCRLNKLQSTNSDFTSGLIGCTSNIERPEVHPQKIIFKCTYCDYTTNENNDFIRHQKMYSSNHKHHVKLHESSCHLNKSLQSTNSEFTSGLNVCTSNTTPEVHPQKTIFKCTYCDYTTNENNDFTRHQKMYCKLNPIKCAYCSFTNINKSVMIIHERKHTGIKPYQCFHCNFVARNIEHLKKHLIMHARNKLRKQKVHERKHIGIKPYQCFHCNFVARNIEHLKKHLIMHARNKLRKQKIHERKHTGIKPYQCFHCNFVARNIEHLKKHLNMHARNNLRKQKRKYKVYKCQYCNFTSNFKKNMENHLRICYKKHNHNYDRIHILLEHDYCETSAGGPVV